MFAGLACALSAPWEPVLLCLFSKEAITTSISSYLQLPFLAPAQTQKHVTLNEALLLPDMAAQLNVVSATLSAQPSNPTEGAVYILPASKSGADWGGMASQALACWVDGAWRQITPREGWRAFVCDSNQFVGFDGAAWTQAVLRTGLGLGSAALKNTGVSGNAVPLLDGANTFSQAQFMPTLVISSGFPAFKLVDTDGPTDARTLFTVMDGGDYTVFKVNDSNSVFNPYLSFSRSGDSPTQATVHAPLRPSTDAGMALGEASKRWAQVYAATGTINTSDARDKTELRPVLEAGKAAARRVLAGLGVFQWLSSVVDRGDAGARLHIRVTAQAVRDAFAAEGLDAARYGLFCADPLTERVEIVAREQRPSDCI
jgi:hypothetical protein